ncbi:MAG: hypothetical protein F4Z14_08450 [Gammaproteobacteria bacterium]|nr:hypothetical protein [Gammaproteobacteria bacterium]
MTIGIVLTWSGVVFWRKLRIRYTGVSTISSSYLRALLSGAESVLEKPFKLFGLILLAPVLTIGLAFGIGVLLMVFAGFTAVEVIEEPSLRLQYALVGGGFLLSFITIYILTVLCWSKTSLAPVLEDDDRA